MKQVLVTGANGQLGQCIQALADKYTQFSFLFTDIDTLDIGNRETVMTYMQQQHIDYVINCAAYTAVDHAEEEEAKAFRVNCGALQNLAEACCKLNAKIIHISTDYVFDGKSYSPYTERDIPKPVSSYGRTKYAGEQVLRDFCAGYVILRTGWLYSEYGKNFCKTMYKLAQERDELRVVFDQVGTPTYAGDLAATILFLLEQAEEGSFSPGIYHFSNEGVCSWYDFARKIVELSGFDCKVTPIESKEYPAAAARPPYSVLNKGKIKHTYQIAIPHWEESLKAVINRLTIND
ncbi:dTDP-4-dehydrorhamnose reductase [Parabacteroides sp. OttesenSCG-928-N08]|nr:dTDP-4-dehydrorhamnose reductase [Parabacteroides sp. OttesenSCG-928-N08]